MYHHIKKLMYTVHIGTPDPRFGNMLLEQFGGANGAAAMTALPGPWHGSWAKNKLQHCSPTAWAKRKAATIS